MMAETMRRESSIMAGPGHSEKKASFPLRGEGSPTRRSLRPRSMPPGVAGGEVASIGVPSTEGVPVLSPRRCSDTELQRAWGRRGQVTSKHQKGRG